MNLWLSAVVFGRCQKRHARCVRRVSNKLLNNMPKECSRVAQVFLRIFFEVASLAFGEHSDSKMPPVTSLFLSSCYKLILFRSLQSQFCSPRKQQEEGWRGVLAEVHAGAGAIGHYRWWNWTIAHIYIPNGKMERIWCSICLVQAWRGLPRICWMGQLEYGKHVHIFAEPSTYYIYTYYIYIYFIR